MEKGDQKIGFGIMGGWNQGQAHAQFVSNIADYGMTIQQALEAGRFTKGSFEGCDVQIESLVPEAVRAELKARGHDLRVVGPRTGTFGYGQAVMLGPGGVHFGASEPQARRRRDSAGAAGLRDAALRMTQTKSSADAV